MSDSIEHVQYMNVNMFTHFNINTDRYLNILYMNVFMNIPGQYPP